MALQDKLFTSRSIQDLAGYHAEDRFNRSYLMDSDTAEGLNAYKNMGIFNTMNDVGNFWDTWDHSKSTNYKDLPFREAQAKARSGAPGVRSLFNPFAAALTGNEQPRDLMDKKINTQKSAWADLVASRKAKISHYRFSNNTPLMDTPEIRKQIRMNAGCSVKELVQASQAGVFGKAPYQYSDFMYCKYLGRVPNNYLITLRRFSTPITDSIMPVGRSSARRNKYMRANTTAPLGTMVTWLGVSGNNINEILSYSFNMPFEYKQAEWQNASQAKVGGDSGILNGLEAAMNPATRQAYMDGANIPVLSNLMGSMFNVGGAGPYPQPGTWRDQTKVYGPIDAVRGTYRRSEEGLKWDQNFTINFDYELRSYNGINPRQAMLDLIANILTVTYTKGNFWGGGVWGWGMRQSSAFSNMNIFKSHGTFTEYMDAFSKDVQAGVRSVQNMFSSEPVEMAKQVLNALGGMLIGGLLNQLGRPARYQLNSLLSDAPVGLWHITIGNPHRPIMAMGNMILKNTKITHSGPLGLDDFPTNLTVSCEFCHGRPRDLAGNESLYNKGQDRIIQPMSSAVFDMYASAAAYKAGKDSEGTSISNASKDVLEKVERQAEQQEQARNSVPPKAKEDIKTNKSTAKASSTQKTALEVQSIELTTPGYIDEQQNILKEVFGDPDMTALLWSSREQSEGAFRKSPPEASPNANNSDAGDKKTSGQTDQKSKTK